MTLDDFKSTLNRIEQLGEPHISIELFKKAVETIDALTQEITAIRSEFHGLPEENYGLKTRIQELELVSIKLETERNAAVEIHKQVLREVLSIRDNNPQTKDLR